MAKQAPRFLSAPRDGGEIERRFVHEQADFYRAVLKDDPFHVLIPCCSRCTSQNVFESHVKCAIVCSDCGNKDSSTEIRAGRIAQR